MFWKASTTNNTTQTVSNASSYTINLSTTTTTSQPIYTTGNVGVSGYTAGTSWSGYSGWSGGSYKQPTRTLIKESDERKDVDGKASGTVNRLYEERDCDTKELIAYTIYTEIWEDGERKDSNSVYIKKDMLEGTLSFLRKANVMEDEW